MSRSQGSRYKVSTVLYKTTDFIGTGQNSVTSVHFVNSRSLYIEFPLVFAEWLLHDKLCIYVNYVIVIC